MITILIPVLFLLPISARHADTETSPLVVDPMTLDMGKVKSGEIYVDNFVFRNISDKDIKLLYISTECDCAVEVPTHGVVPAHGTLKLPAKLLTHTPEDIQIEEGINVFIDHPHQQELKLYVRARVLGSGKPPPKETVVTKKKNETVDVPEEKDAQKTGSPMYAAYFYKPQCIDCERAWKIIQKVQVEYPNWEIREYDITKRKNVLICENMGINLGLKRNEVLKTPAIYFSSRALVGEKEITKENLKKVLESRSTGLAQAPWEEMEEVDNEGIRSLVEKGHNLSAIAIVLAGLVDGVNPCAFATLIFFVSFLRVMKRTRFEIALIGLTFTLAVFLTYMGVGLGFFSGIKPLVQFRWVTFGFYSISALIALGFSVLSFRDAIRAKQGNLKEMSLQLSDNMKQRIRKIISDKSRNSGIVIGAFITGVVVSLLELGCTGQVYLPVITFILQVPELRVRGILFLAAYNVAFILPLLIVFAMVFFGAGWEKTNRWFMDNIYKTKIILGLVFMLLAGLIFFNIITHYILL
jgi:cytochrome c biogenesis protein CcdA